jgi:catechol 2,3-dioxygenase-like lactoylglutathione lyase family enzyme
LTLSEGDVIRNLQHLALAVPDVEASRKFYETFGLTGAERGDTVVMRCHGRDQDQVVLLEGAKRRTHHLSFGVAAADLPAVGARLEAQDVALLDPPYPGAPDGLWFRDPDGTLVNLQAAPAQPIASQAPTLLNSPGDFRRIGQRGVPSRDLQVRPRRLGHVLLFTPDVPRLTRFYTELLGMRLSDTVAGDVLAFMRCAGDSDHHVLALAHSDRPGFHHASFEVGSLDEIMFGVQRLVESGYRPAWGLGRHVIGSNFFYYIRDPWNGMAEYFWDIDFVPGDMTWPVQDWAPKDGFFLWSSGGPPPADFVQNFENE